MILEPKEAISDAELEKSLKYVHLDGVFSQLMVVLTSGVILVNFALELGASNLFIGLMAAIPLLTQFFQLPSILLVERYKNRRLVSMFGAFGSRLSYIIIIITPLFFQENIVLVFLLVFLFIQSAFTAITGCSWGSWMHDLVPPARRGNFFSSRMSRSLLVTLPVMILTGLLLDGWQALFGNDMGIFSLFFASGAIFGVISMVFIGKTSEPIMTGERLQITFTSLVKTPFKENNFKNMLVFLMILNFAINLAAPFYTVYLFQRIHLEVVYVMGLTILSQITHIFFINIWGKLAERYTNKAVLNLCTAILVTCMIGWTFTTLPDTYFLTFILIIIIHALMGISTAGINIASLNIGLKLSPKGMATSYLATKNFLNALVAAIAPILGGLLMDFFGSVELAITVQWLSPTGELIFQTLNFQAWDFLFFFGFLIGLASLFWNGKISEDGIIQSKITIKELLFEVKRSLRNYSTIAGVRSMSQVSHVARRSKKGSKKAITNKQASQE